eukprot:gb/GEZN01010120.1/.p1 GENE.gb/GEZN01010120.1/~~gb/GEZN01010120.1/.p1  ORF type:complete len:237 (+),score=76.77 gb/GEZN01010120.1/:158-868(+)
MGDLSPELFKEFTNGIGKKGLEEQAQFFLNAFWEEWGEENKETVWRWCAEMMEIDLEAWQGEGKKKEDYKARDSLSLQWAMKMLEKQGKALSPIQYKKEFKKIDVNFDGNMSLLEYALYESKRTLKQLMEAPQTTTAEVETCKKKLAEVQQKFKEHEDKKDKVRIKAQTGTGLAALQAKQEWEKIQQEDNGPLEREMIKAENNLKKAQKKIPPPAGTVWWEKRRVEESEKYGSKKK